MPHFVAVGKSISCRRGQNGLLTGGDEGSEVSWKDFCGKDLSRAGAEKDGNEQIERLVVAGSLVEADEMPISPAEILAAEKRESFSQEVALGSPQERRPQTEPKDASVKTPPPPLVQTVDMGDRGEPEPAKGPPPAAKRVDPLAPAGAGGE